MDKKDVMYGIAAVVIILIMALVVKPMMTGQPVEYRYPCSGHDCCNSEIPQLLLSLCPDTARDNPVYPRRHLRQHGTIPYRLSGLSIPQYMVSP